MLHEKSHKLFFLLCSIFLLLSSRDVLAMELVGKVVDIDCIFSDHKLKQEDIDKANEKNTALILKDAFGQRDELWKEITHSPYSFDNLPTQEPSKGNSGNMLRKKKHLRGIFSPDRGPYPIKGYVKHTHMYGATAMVNVEMDKNSSLTGWFKEGGPALARFSLIKIGNGMESFAPNVSLMTFHKGRMPKSIVSMCSVDGQQKNLHFFYNSFTNLAGPAHQTAAQLIEKTFMEIGAEIEAHRKCSLLDPNMPNFLRLPLEEHASMTSEGIIIEDAVAPYEIIFIASDELKNAYQKELSNNEEKDFREIIAIAMSNVEHLFDIYARDEKSAKLVWQSKWEDEANRKDFYDTGVSKEDMGSLMHIGLIKRESDVVASEFADKMLFRHPSEVQ